MKSNSDPGVIIYWIAILLFISSIATVLLYGHNIKTDEIGRAVEQCDKNGGLDKIYITRVNINAHCQNGAKFKIE